MGRQKEKNCYVKKIYRTKSKANNKLGRDLQTKKGLILIVSKSNNEKYLYKICQDVCSGILREAYLSVKQAGALSRTEPRTRAPQHTPARSPEVWHTDHDFSVTERKATVSWYVQVGSRICFPQSHRSTRPHKAPKGPRAKLWSSPLWGTEGGGGSPTPTIHFSLSRLLCSFACFTTDLSHNSKKTNTVAAISNCLSTSNLLYFLSDWKPSF